MTDQGRLPGRCVFRQSDLQRTLKAAIAAGLRVTGFEIKPDGSI
jgi:hypothetical protein